MILNRRIDRHTHYPCQLAALALLVISTFGVQAQQQLSGEVWAGSTGNSLQVEVNVEAQLQQGQFSQDDIVLRLIAAPGWVENATITPRHQNIDESGRLQQFRVDFDVAESALDGERGRLLFELVPGRDDMQLSQQRIEVYLAVRNPNDAEPTALACNSWVENEQEQVIRVAAGDYRGNAEVRFRSASAQLTIRVNDQFLRRTDCTDREHILPLTMPQGSPAFTFEVTQTCDGEAAEGYWRLELNCPIFRVEFKLVDIRGPQPSPFDPNRPSSGGVEFQSGSPGYTLRKNGEVGPGQERPDFSISSFSFTRFPRSFVLGEPFEIEVNRKTRSEVLAPQSCIDPTERSLKDIGVIEAKMSHEISETSHPLDFQARARGSNPYAIFCDEVSDTGFRDTLFPSIRVYNPVVKEAETRLLMSFKPVSEPSGFEYVDYEMETSTNGGGAQAVKSSAQLGTRRKIVEFEDLQLVYDTEGAEALPIAFRQAPEFGRRAPVATEVVTLDDLVTQPSLGDIEGRPDELAEDADMVQLPDLSGMSASQVREEFAGMDLTPTFSVGDAAPSPDLVGKVAGQEPVAGTVIQPGSSVKVEMFGPLPAATIVPDLSGLTSGEARQRIRRTGLIAQPAVGASAPRAELVGTVSSQHPPAGYSAQPGSDVEFSVYGPLAASVTVPELVGLSGRDASRELERLGLRAEAKLGPAARSMEKAGSVLSQSLAAGARVEPNTSIVLLIAAPAAAAVTVPDVRGLGQDAAVARLEAGRLRYRIESAGPPDSQAQSGKVATQDPVAGFSVAQNTPILIRIFGEYVPTPQEQVASLDCGRWPNSEARWNAQEGRARCVCLAGFRAMDQGCVKEQVVSVPPRPPETRTEAGTDSQTSTRPAGTCHPFRKPNPNPRPDDIFEALMWGGACICRYGKSGTGACLPPGPPKEDGCPPHTNKGYTDHTRLGIACMCEYGEDGEGNCKVPGR